MFCFVRVACIEAKKRPALPVIAVLLSVGAIASLRWNCSSAIATGRGWCFKGQRRATFLGWLQAFMSWSEMSDR